MEFDNPLSLSSTKKNKKKRKIRFGIKIKFLKLKELVTE
jgi:hypothetical protein